MTEDCRPSPVFRTESTATAKPKRSELAQQVLDNHAKKIAEINRAAHAKAKKP